MTCLLRMLPVLTVCTKFKWTPVVNTVPGVVCPVLAVNNVLVLHTLVVVIVFYCQK